MRGAVSEQRVVWAEAVGTDGDGLVGGKRGVYFDGEEILCQRDGTAEGGEPGRRVEGECGERAADELLAVSALLLLGELAERGHALFDDRRGHGVCSVEGPGAGVGARRKRKEMEVTEGQSAKEGKRLVEFAIGFTGEAGHDVGAEGERGAGGAEDGFDLLRVVPGAVAAVHAAEDGVRPGLEREMGVAGDAGSTELIEQGDEIGVPIHGLDGAEAEKRESGFFEYLADQARQRGLRLAGLRCEIAPPAAEIDAGEDEFPAPGRNKAARLREDACGGQAARGAAGLGNHAEGTAVATALLDFEIGAGLQTRMDGRFLKERMREAFIHKHLRCGSRGLRRRADLNELRCLRRREQVEGDGGRECLVTVADDGGDAGQGGDLVGCALGVAAGDDDACVGVAAVDAADVGAGGAVGFRGDGACVDQDQIGASGQRVGEAGCCEGSTDGLGIGTGGSASEVFDMEGQGAAPLGQGLRERICCFKGKVARSGCKGGADRR